MPLFVPVLRSAMLFMNIYDTYKTLKAPPPSSRDPTRPSVRATTQRKRDLKGCLAVWIVWCCFTLYERLVESLVNLFIPFYDEFKSMVILFLILTRARGAEPIFLHILRPLIRPYDTSIDGTLDVLRMTGDFIFALGAFPIQQAIKMLRSRFEFLASYLPGDDFDNTCEPPQVEAKASRPTASRQSTGATVQPKRKPASRRASDDFIPDDFLQSPPPATGLALSNGTPYSPSHQIWSPPSSAYQEEDPDDGADPGGFNGAINAAHNEHDVEDWRKYPAFPSAYPATPPTATTNLPPSFGAAATNLFNPLPNSQESFAASRQDFHRSLKPTRKLQNPSSANNLSDENHQSSGILQSYGPSGATSETAVETDDDSENMSDDEMSYDEEDSFDKTLQTPFHRRVLLSPPRAPPLSTFPSQSTAIDSVGTVTSLQTRTISGSSASSHSISPHPLSSTNNIASHSSTDVEMEADLPVQSADEANSKLRQRSGTVTRERPIVTRRRTLRAVSPSVKKRKVARPALASGERSATASTTTPGIANHQESGQTAPGAGTSAPDPDVYIPNDQKVQPEPKRPRVAANATASRKGAPFTSHSTVKTPKARVARRSSPPSVAPAPLRAPRVASNAVKAARVQLTGTKTSRATTSVAASSSKSQSGKSVAGRMVDTGPRGQPASNVGSATTEQRTKNKLSKDQTESSSTVSSLEPGNQSLGVPCNEVDIAPPTTGI